MRLIGAFKVNDTMIFGQEAKDLLSKLCSGCSKTKGGMDIGSLLLLKSQVKGWEERDSGQMADK